MKIAQIMFYSPKLHLKKKLIFKIKLEKKKNINNPKINELSSEKKKEKEKRSYKV